MQNKLERTETAFVLKGEAAESTIREYLVASALHQIERVRFFVETEGLHPDSTYRGKPTALCYSVLKPYPCLMEYLCEKGADVNNTDILGMTPLHYAALGGCEYCIGYLIGAGAQLNTANKCGDTPLALTLNRSDLASCREFLQRHGASLARTVPQPPRFH